MHCGNRDRGFYSKSLASASFNQEKLVGNSQIRKIKTRVVGDERCIRRAIRYASICYDPLRIGAWIVEYDTIVHDDYCAVLIDLVG